MCSINKFCGIYVLLFIFLLILGGVVHADDVWVDNMVAASGDGSQVSPYKTMTEAIDNAVSGSTIHVLNTGQPYTGSRYLINHKDNLMILGENDGSGNKPVIQPQNDYSVDIDSSYNITFQNIDFDLSKNTSNQRTFVVRYGEHITIKDCIFRDGNYHNIDIRRGKHFVIENNLIHDILADAGDAHGIVVDGQAENIIVRNNEIYNCSGDCIQLEESSPGTPTDVLIEGNRFYRSTLDNNYYLNMGKQVPENGMDIKEAQNLTIRGNTVYNFIDYPSGSPAAILIRAREPYAIRNVLIEENRIFNNDNAFTLSKGSGALACDSITVRRNVIYNALKSISNFIPGGAIKFEDATNIKIYQNTFYNMYDHFFSFDEGGPINIDIRNNLFAQPDGAWPVDFSFCLHGNPNHGFRGEVIVRNNGYFGISDGASTCGSGIRSDQTETEENIILGADGQGIFVDPTNDSLGIRDFHLSGTAGLLDVGEIFLQEYQLGGTYYGLAPDLGKWEYDSGTGELNAYFIGSDTVVYANHVIEFFDLSSSGVTAWEWDFGDNGSSTEQNPSHTYTVAGLYSVTLRVSNNTTSDTLTRVDYITVLEETLPQVDFKANPKTILQGEAVTFTDQTTGTDLNQWFWDFGDNNTSTEQNPVHTYWDAGKFTITLVVTSKLGVDTLSRKDYITVDETTALVAQFSVDKTEIDEVGEIKFSDQSIGFPIQNWFWDFGDGETSTEQNPMHTYFTPGQYDVTLIVSNVVDRDTLIEKDYITVNKRSGTLVFLQNGRNSYSGVEDTWIIGGPRSTNNYATNDWGNRIGIYGDGADNYTMIKFTDLSVVPRGVTILNATLRMKLDEIYNPHVAAAYIVKRDWVWEEVTWEEYAKGKPWQVAGCKGADDREQTPIDIVNVDTSLYVSGDWNEWDITSAVADWVSGVKPNYGVIICATDSLTKKTDWFPETSGIEKGPMLLISYTTENAVNANGTSLPTSFSLSQNYPNPFNPSTTIHYAIPVGAKVQVDLTVYNLLGKLVRTLVKKNQPAGNYSVIWNGKDDYNHSVPSGIYVYRLNAGSFCQTRKLILVR